MTETQTTISKWLESVGRDTGTTLSLDQDGHCNILFGDQLECMVEVPEDSVLVFMYTALKRAPDDAAARVQLLELALELNLFSIATGGASLAFDRRTQQIVLTFSGEVMAMDEDFFKGALGDLLDLAIDLHQKLQEDLPVTAGFPVHRGMAGQFSKA